MLRRGPNMTHKHLIEALEETVGFIERALDRITRDEGAEAELRCMG
jgi:hypothetical protein